MRVRLPVRARCGLRAVDVLGAAGKRLRDADTNARAKALCLHFHSLDRTLGNGVVKAFRRFSSSPDMGHTGEKPRRSVLLFSHHLDYISCLLTITSTALVGRRLWQGWLVAGVNSVIISLIGLRTGQWGFVPANLFCIAIYLYNIRQWRTPARPTNAAPASHRISALASASKRPMIHRRAS